MAHGSREWRRGAARLLDGKRFGVGDTRTMPRTAWWGIVNVDVVWPLPCVWPSLRRALWLTRWQVRLMWCGIYNQGGGGEDGGGGGDGERREVRAPSSRDGGRPCGTPVHTHHSVLAAARQPAAHRSAMRRRRPQKWRGPWATPRRSERGRVCGERTRERRAERGARREREREREHGRNAGRGAHATGTGERCTTQIVYDTTSRCTTRHSQ
jgi:hypothetical protein